MPRIFATATLRHLAQRNLLEDRGFIPGEPRESVAEFLRALLSSPEGLGSDSCPPSWTVPLEEHFLVSISEKPVPRPGLAFAFVEAINFELTYGCNLACKHCLQDALRPTGSIPWIDTGLVIQALKDAAWLGLVRTGVNFTGGEVYLPGSPVLELIKFASDSGINVRCNTNAWWGGRTNFTVGDTRFDSDAGLVSYLKDIGLKVLVMSLDDRYEQYPDLLDRVLQVAACCEEIGQLYEIVATDPSMDLVKTAFGKLIDLIGREPRCLVPTPMDTVDIGAAAGPSATILWDDRIANLTTQSPCQRKGFFRPYYLHVNPGGGVRSCLYAPGASVLGNLTRERLPGILNRADQNPVVRLFSGRSIEDFVETHITPWRHLYRNVEHPCAASALVARVAGSVANETGKVGQTLSVGEMERIHRSIAREWNLGRATSP